MTTQFSIPRIVHSSRTAIVLTALALGVSATALYVLKQRKAKTQEPVIHKEVKYVFFAANGKSITLSEQEVYSIRQMHENGVQPSAIGDKFGLETLMVMRIINSIKSV